MSTPQSPWKESPQENRGCSGGGLVSRMGAATSPCRGAGLCQCRRAPGAQVPSALRLGDIPGPAAAPRSRDWPRCRGLLPSWAPRGFASRVVWPRRAPACHLHQPAALAAPRVGDMHSDWPGRLSQGRKGPGWERFVSAPGAERPRQRPAAGHGVPAAPKAATEEAARAGAVTPCAARGAGVPSRKFPGCCKVWGQAVSCVCASMGARPVPPASAHGQRTNTWARSGRQRPGWLPPSPCTDLPICSPRALGSASGAWPPRSPQGTQ